MRSAALLSIVFGVLASIEACAGSVSNPSTIAPRNDGGARPSPNESATDGSRREASTTHRRDASIDASSYADHCPAASRAGTMASIGACPAGPLAFEKPRALLAASSIGRDVTFRALHQYAIAASDTGQGGVASFVVTFAFPSTPSAAVTTTVLELPATDRSRSIVALGPRPSSLQDPAQFEALACDGSDCAFYVPSGAALARDTELPTVPKDDYQRVECRNPGDTCELCVVSPTARRCLEAGGLKAENAAVPDVGICCPVSAEDTRWAGNADFRGLSRLALTQSGDLLNDLSVSTNGGACCVQASGFGDAVGFDVITCGQASNPMILTGSALYGTTSCAFSH